MIRSKFFLMLVLASWCAFAPRAAEAGPLDAKTIKVALHTATPEEDGFIDHVLALVNRGNLPLDMVESTFLWARKKPYHKFQYFKRGLTVRAEQQGIQL